MINLDIKFNLSCETPSFQSTNVLLRSITNVIYRSNFFFILFS